MPSLKHAHTYQRMQKKPNLIYRCVDPDCSHYSKAQFILGKRAACICGNLFILTKESLQLKHPHCERCGKNYVKKQRQLEEAITKFKPTFEDMPPELRKPPGVREDKEIA